MASHTSESDMVEDEIGELLFEYEWDVDAPRVNQLGFFDHRSRSPSPSPKPFDGDKHQTLSEGTVLGSKFRARLQGPTFGKYYEKPACLLVISINFKPKSYSGALRFRDATVEVELGSGTGVVKNSPSNSLQVVKIYPEYEEGPVKSSLEEFDFKIEGNAIPLGTATMGPSIGYSVSRPREGRRRIHGSIEGEGDLENLVEWKLEENRVAGDGIPEHCKFALIVRYPENEVFHMTMRIKATTGAGLGVTGRGGNPIYFPPSMHNQLENVDEPIREPRVTDRTAAGEAAQSSLSGTSSSRVLETIDLQVLTDTSRTLRQSTKLKK
jgi:hypothetical protein